MWRAFSISFTTATFVLLALGFLSLFGCPSSGAKLQRVDADFNAIGSAIEAYRRNTGHYPATEQGLAALVSRPTTGPLADGWSKIAERIPIDPWENTYTYRLLPEDDDRGFELRSAGKDGKHGTKDDLSSLDPKD